MLRVQYAEKMSPPKIETIVVCPPTSSLDAILHFKLQCIKDKSVFIDYEHNKVEHRSHVWRHRYHQLLD